MLSGHGEKKDVKPNLRSVLYYAGNVIMHITVPQSPWFMGLAMPTTQAVNVSYVSNGNALPMQIIENTEVRWRSSIGRAPAL